MNLKTVNQCRVIWHILEFFKYETNTFQSAANTKKQYLKHCVDLDNMCYSLSLVSVKYVQKTAQSLCTLLLQLIRLLLFYGERKNAFNYIFREMHSSGELLENKIFYLNSDECPKAMFILFILWKDINECSIKMLKCDLTIGIYFNINKSKIPHGNYISFIISE